MRKIFYFIITAFWIFILMATYEAMAGEKILYSKIKTI
jgi:hypothetical protein